MRIVLIDSNVWNLFWEQELDLSLELQSDVYQVLNSLLLDIEIQAIKENKPDLYRYIKEQLAKLNSSTLKTFAFCDLSDDGSGQSSHYPENIKVGGFNEGHLVDKDTIDKIWDAFLSTRDNSARGTDLPKHFTDQDLVAHADYSLVLTLDKKMINRGHKNVIDMADFNSENLRLADYINQKLQESSVNL